MRLSTTAIEHLASSYAVGSLRGGARRRFESHMNADPDISRLVEAWQLRLQPLYELQHNAVDNEALAPPAAAWSAIEARLGLTAQSAQIVSPVIDSPMIANPMIAVEAEKQARAIRSTPKASPSLWQQCMTALESIKLWSAGGFVGAGLALGALVFFSVNPINSTDSGKTTYIAAYSATLKDKELAVLTVNSDAAFKSLRVQWTSAQGVAAQTPFNAATQSLQLWAIADPSTGLPPVSLGLVKNVTGATQIELSADLATRLKDKTIVVAVSLEPLGGSPNANAPSGPVIYQGAWAKTL